MLAVFKSISGPTHVTMTLITVNLRGSRSTKVLKSVLTSKSPVFTVMLESEMTERHTNTIVIDDFDADVVEEVILFLNTGHCVNLTRFPEKIIAFADKYQIEKLLKKCDSYFHDIVNDMNAAHCLAIAYFYNRLQLKKKLMGYVARKIRYVVKSQEWTSLVADFGLTTELALYLAKKNRHETTELLETGRSDSCLKLMWSLSRSLLHRCATSPKFEMTVGKENLEFRCFFFSNKGSSELSFLITVMNDDFKMPLRLQGDFLLINSTTLRTKRYSGSRLLVWNGMDVKHPTYSISRQKLALSIPKDELLNNKFFTRDFVSLHIHLSPLRGRPMYGRPLETSIEARETRACCNELYSLPTYLDLIVQPMRSQFIGNLIEANLGSSVNPLIPFGQSIDHEQVLIKPEIPSSLIDDVVHAFILSHELGSKKMKLEAKNIIKRNFTATINSPSWTTLSKYPSLLTELLLAI